MMQLNAKEEALLLKMVDQFSQARILVVGDVMLDEYIWGAISRISPEAPVPIAEVQSMTHVPGGSANVANNIQALGATSVLLGVIGKDSSAEKLKKKLKQLNIDIANLIQDSKRPTTLKSRIVAHNQHVIRVDREDRSPLNPKIHARLLQRAEKLLPTVHALLLSDYNKGILTPAFTKTLIQKAKKRKKWITVDPKGMAYTKYRGATIITPNQHEAEVASHIPITHERSLKKAGEWLLKKLALPYLLITQGKEGMTLFIRKGEIVHIPAAGSEVYDITGAGDTAISTLTLALASGAPIQEAVKLSNLAAGLVVKKIGTSTISQEELRQAVLSYRNE